MSKLAKVLVGHSCALRPGERVYIESLDTPPEMVCALIEAVAEAGGIPFVRTTDSRVCRALCDHASEDQLDIMARCDRELIKEMQYCITLLGVDSTAGMSDLPNEKMSMILNRWANPTSEHRLRQTKWITLHWPTPSMAKLAGMSTEALEDLYFEVCTLDYGRMARAVEPLKDRMERTDVVRIRGVLDTDIMFSIRDMPAVICAGSRNLPDGELFTAPVKDSANGVIHFNAETMYHGRSFSDIRLTLRNGSVVEATSSNTEALNNILDTDKGARCIGEFALGLNPRINRVMRDTLFDEKMAGSLHFTPGQAFAEADNGNCSSIHWDMVMVQTPALGGGEIYFDDELIRKDGRFVPGYLQCLNPENLVRAGVVAA